MADLLRQLGDLPAHRVRMTPHPGTATLADLSAWNEHHSPTCEWIDGTLVEKAMGQFESWVSSVVSGELYIYLKANDIGMLYGEAAVLRILPGLGRAADTAFVPWSKLPGGKPPRREDRVPAVVPALAVEVLSASNTKAEMVRKRGEYFRAGVRLVWEIDPETRSADVYTGPDAVTPVPAGGVLEGADVLPGFTLSLQELFDRAERHRPA